MSRGPFRIRTLSLNDDRTLFFADRYLQQKVTQDIRRRVAAFFVALTDENRIAGFYTLATAGVLLMELPTSITKNTPYPFYSCREDGTISPGSGIQWTVLGGALLADILDRSSHSEITIFAVVVDTKDEQSIRFYQHHGFVLLPNASNNTVSSIQVHHTNKQVTTLPRNFTCC